MVKEIEVFCERHEGHCPNYSQAFCQNCIHGKVTMYSRPETADELAENFINQRGW